MVRDFTVACIALFVAEIAFPCRGFARQSIDSPPPGAPGYEELAHAYNKLSKGELEEAIKFAQRARSLAPDAEAPVRLLTDVSIKLRRLREAVTIVNEYAASHEPSGSLFLQRANLHRLLREFEGAAADFRKAREAGGLTKAQEAAAAAELYQITLAPAYDSLAAGKYRSAIEAAQKARRLDAGAEAPVQVLVEAHEKLGQPAEALGEADRYISQNTASWRLLAQRGYLRRSLSDLKGAIADFDAVLARSGLPPDEADKLREATEEAKLAQAQPGGAVLGYEELDRAYEALAAGDFELAIGEAREARAKDPKAEGPVLVLMSALRRPKQPRAALEEANRFVSENQPSPALLAQRGYLRRSLSDLRGAVGDFRAALSSPGLDPRREKNVRVALAEALLAQSRPGAEWAPAAEEAAKPSEQALDRAYETSKVQRLLEAVEAAREARGPDANSETPTLILIDALKRLGRKGEALAEADRFLAVAPKSASLLAQRGLLRRQMQDVQGAISDFGRALSLEDLPSEQKAIVSEALGEARYFLVADKAFKASAAHDWAAALKYSRMAQSFSRADEAIFRVSIEALAQSNRFGEALRASDALIARGKASGQARAQRGFVRERAGDHAGAAADFSAALARGGLRPVQRQEVRRALALANSAALEARGDRAEALEELLAYSRENPKDARIRAALGRFYSRQKRYEEALATFENSLAIERRGDALLEAGYTGVHVDRTRESQYFREALDRWSSDPTLNSRPERNRVMVETQVVEADASTRTNIVYGNILARPQRWGGYQNDPSIETAIRFDGRYLPFVNGLEGFVGGQWSQDQTKFTESHSRIGLRLRPFEGINFSISGEFQHRFDSKPLDQFALSWAYGYGGFAYTSAEGGAAAASALETAANYPFESGWRPLTSFATYGTFRTGEKRYLQDALGLLGYAYWSVEPLRAMIGPAAMAGASYDSLDNRPLAFGIGPAAVFRTWIGGDQYRAYDALLTVQVGYLFPFGESGRQGGLRTRIGLTF